MNRLTSLVKDVDTRRAIRSMHRDVLSGLQLLAKQQDLMTDLMMHRGTLENPYYVLPVGVSPAEG